MMITTPICSKEYADPIFQISDRISNYLPLDIDYLKSIASFTVPEKLNTPLIAVKLKSYTIQQNKIDRVLQNINDHLSLRIK